MRPLLRACLALAWLAAPAFGQGLPFAGAWRAQTTISIAPAVVELTFRVEALARCGPSFMHARGGGRRPRP